jgi:signal transduction histidine kinase
MKYLRLLIGVLLFFAAQWVEGQKPYSDSLKLVLIHTKDPHQRVDLLCEMAYDLFDFNDSAAEHYALQAKKIAEESNYQSGLKYALTIIGLGNFSFGDYQTALKNFYASSSINAPQPGALTGYNLMLIGSTYRDLAYYDSAAFYYKKAIQAVGDRGDPYYLGFIYWGLANMKAILWQNNEALDYLKRGASYAIQKPRDYYVLMNIWDLYGRVYSQSLDYERADAYFKKMCEQEKHTPDYLQKIKCQMYESQVAYRQGDLAHALSWAFKALEVSDIYRYPQQRVQVYTQIGIIYSELSQFSLAIQYFLEGLKISEGTGLRFEMADLYARLAWVYKDESSFASAHEYLNKSEVIRSTIGDKLGMSDCQNIRGLVYFLQQEYDKSMIEFTKALTIRKTIGNELKKMAIISNMALVYEAWGKNDLALDYLLQALAIEEKLDSKLNMGISYNSISLLMIKMKRFAEAEHYLKKAIDLSLATETKFLRRNIYLNYAKLFEATGNLPKAIMFHNRYELLNDSIFSENSNIKLAEMQALYQVEKKEQEIRLLDQQRKAQERELGSQRKLGAQQRFIITLSLAAIVMLLVAGVLVFRYSREKYRDNRSLQKLNREINEQKEEIQAQSEELVEASEAIASINKELEVKIEDRTSELKQAYKELDTFFYRASHDFRRPITTFMGLAGVAKITVKDLAALELFEKVNETATSLDKMLYKLQSISDVGSQQMIFKEVFLKELIEEVLDGFTKMIQQKRIVVSLEISEQTPLVSYPAMVKIIIENLVENAIHFAAFESPLVVIKALVYEEVAVIEVEDNGQGIMDDYKPRIFEMYFRANEHSKGNGLGLYIAKKATEKLSGHISFKSKYGAGSLFTVELPNRGE